MRHDPERDAARLLGGVMPAAEQVLGELLLLGCPECWDEVEQGRRGRSLAEAARTVAPTGLRERVRGLVEAESLGAPAAPRIRLVALRRRWLLPAGVPVAAAAVVALILTSSGGTAEPPSLRSAVADFTAQRLPGAQLPEQQAPDLSQLQLQPIGAGGGTYAGLDVDGYAYRDPAGRRVVLYLSDKPFPEAPGAELLAGPDGPWVAERGDVVVLCARVPHALLVVGQDDELVLSAASALGVL
jgi:hypothetical protein